MIFFLNDFKYTFSGFEFYFLLKPVLFLKGRQIGLLNSKSLKVKKNVIDF